MKGPEDTTSEEHVPDSIVTFQKQDDSKSSTETSTEDSSSLLQPSPPKRTNQTSQKLKRWSKMIKHTFPSNFSFKLLMSTVVEIAPPDLESEFTFLDLLERMFRLLSMS